MSATAIPSPDRLRELEEFLKPEGFPQELRTVAARARARVGRDLLPRAEHGIDYAVVAIVGPNNSGKSSLFNALAGAAVSPVSPAGGFTRVPVAAVSSQSLEQARPSLGRRFELEVMREHGSGGGFPSIEDVQRYGAPERVLVVTAETIPDGTILIDLPDFDSIYAGNRRAGDAIVLSADMLVVVVTPHTYQNAAVVDFLSEVVEFGRPYCLVYNQSPSLRVAEAHVAKLSGDLGVDPSASFCALLDPRVQSGEAELVPRRISAGADPGEERAGGELKSWLFGGDCTRRSPQAAAVASMLALRRDLELLGSRWKDAARVPARAREALHNILRPHAESAARALFPVLPFREALQQELDDRSLLHQGLRYLPGRLSEALKWTYRSVREQFSSATPATDSAEQFRSQELARLLAESGASGEGRKLAALWEALHHELAAAPVAVSDEALRNDFSPSRRGRLAGELAARHAVIPLPFEDFRRDCARSIAQELDERGVESGLQWAYTALRVLPPAATVVVMALTGAVGDVGALASYLVAEPLLDRSIGRDFVRRIHERWWRQRTAVLTELLEQSLAAVCSAEIVRELESYERGSERLDAWMKELANG